MSSAPLHSIYNPFDRTVLGEMAFAGPLEAVRALQLGAKAAEGAANETMELRLEKLRLLESTLVSSADEIVSQEALSSGFSSKAIRDRELAGLADFLKTTIASMEHSLQSGGARHLFPIGLTTLIAPSTGALSFVGFGIVSALASGCPLVVKFSSKTPLAEKIWNKLLLPLGLSEGRINLLVARGADVGAILLSHPSVRAVVFAGRPETAALARAAAVKDVRRMQIHGGVKNSLLLLKDFDLSSRAAEFLPSLVLGAGRSPWGLSRVYVTEDRVDEFLEMAKSYLSSLEPLKNPEGDSPWTPLLATDRIASVLSAAQQAAGEKGKWIVSPEQVGESFVRPGLMRDLTNCSGLQQEEIAGPLILVTSVKYPHEMAKWTNVPDFGFVASVFGPEEKTEKIIEKLHVGRAWVNQWWPKSEPLFGWKKSFFGTPGAAWNGSFWSQQRL